MNFNEYLKNVHTGMQLNEMLQNDELLSVDEVKKYTQLFFQAIKNKQFSKHFRKAGRDKYPEGSPILADHIAANNFITKMDSSIRKGQNDELISTEKVYPVARNTDKSMDDNGIIAFLFDYHKNALYEIIGNYDKENGNKFVIITAYEVNDKNKLLAYAFKLHGRRIGNIIQQKLIKQNLEDVVPPNTNLATFEDELWSTVRGIRKEERQNDEAVKNQAKSKKLISLIENELGLKSKAQKIRALRPLITTSLDLSSLPIEVKSKVQSIIDKQASKAKFVHAVSQELIQYIKQLRMPNIIKNTETTENTEQTNN